MKKLHFVSLFAMIGFFVLLAGKTEAQVPIGSVMIRTSCRDRAYIRPLRHRHVAHVFRRRVRSVRHLG